MFIYERSIVIINHTWNIFHHNAGQLKKTKERQSDLLFCAFQKGDVWMNVHAALLHTMKVDKSIIESKYTFLRSYNSYMWKTNQYLSHTQNIAY